MRGSRCHLTQSLGVYIPQISPFDFYDTPNVVPGDRFFNEVQKSCKVVLAEDQKGQVYKAMTVAVATFASDARRPSPSKLLRHAKTLALRLQRLNDKWDTAFLRSHEGLDLWWLVEELLISRTRERGSIFSPQTAEPLELIESGLRVLSVVLSDAQERLAAGPAKDGRRPDRYVTDLIVTLADHYEAWGRTASAAYQKTTNRRDTPFIRFVILVCRELRRWLPEEGFDCQVLPYTELEPDALRSRVARVLKARARSKDQKLS